jgi:AraC-like DNA-binding protein
VSIKTIESMVEWIDNNITDNPTLEGMSSYVGYSPYYCSSKFHEHVGMTFKKYLANRRINLAAIDVRNSNDRIIDIAFKYGFLSSEAFSRAFSNIYGRTPNQYRRMHES